MDELVWKEFAADNELLVFEAAKIKVEYFKRPITTQIDLSDLPELPEGIEKERIVRSRLNQKFFREALLSSYNNTCCITGLNISELLVASHIKPWKVSNPKTERTKPSNGLLLNALQDKAFDKGLITVDPSFRIFISPKLHEFKEAPMCRDWILSYKGKQIYLPDRFQPEREFLEYHNDVVFIR